MDEVIARKLTATFGMQTIDDVRFQPRDGLELLMQAVAEGDTIPLTSLYALTAEHLLGVARFILHSKEDAEEVVIDVFTYVWQNAASFDAKRGSVMAWLSVMAKNRAIDLLRRRRPNISLDSQQSDFFSYSSPEKTRTPEQLLSRSQSENALHQALQSIDIGRRDLLRMSFFEGLTHEEISATVGLPLGTVKSHIRRALASLQHSPSLPRLPDYGKCAVPRFQQSKRS